MNIDKTNYVSGALMKMSKVGLTSLIIWIALVSAAIGYLINVVNVDREHARLDMKVYELKDEIRTLETQLKAQEFASQK